MLERIAGWLNLPAVKAGLVLALVAATLAVAIGLYTAGRTAGKAACEAHWQKKQREAEQAARDTEIMWQGVVNGTVRNYEARVARIRGNLDIALDGLRDRPGRASRLSAGAGLARACATGAELCREDAAFLAREASRGEEQAEGAASCYAVIDGLRR